LIIGRGRPAIPRIKGTVEPVDSGGIEVQRNPETKDTLEISQPGKLLRAGGTVPGKRAEGTDDLRSGVSRVTAEIHDRIKSGFYEKDEVVDRIAERLLNLFGF
jgi:hypothetical protein